MRRLLTCSKITITLNVSIRKRLNFHLLSFVAKRYVNKPFQNGTGRRSVPNLKPTLIAIYLPFAAATGGIAWAVDGPGAADASTATTAATPTAATAATTTAKGDQGPELTEI